MADSNHGTLGDALKVFNAAMQPFVRRCLYARFGHEWWERGVMSVVGDPHRGNLKRGADRIAGDERATLLEPAHISRIISKLYRENFANQFDADFGAVTTRLAVIANARNEWAHQRTGDMLLEDAANPMRDMAMVLEAAKLPEAKDIENMRQRLLKVEPVAAPTPSPVPPAASISAPAQAPNQLPYWWQVCEPQDAFKDPNKIDEGLFAATLGGVSTGTARDEYLNPESFLGHTYFTETLKQVIRDVGSRLNGGDGAAVMELQTPFGGGKTHALLTLYHLFNDPKRAMAIPGVAEALSDIAIPANARVFVFDGYLYGTDPVEKELGYSVSSLWGELAYQVDPRLFHEAIAASDGKGEAPGNLIYRRVLEAAAPGVILIDELISYLVKLRFSNTRKTQNQYRQTVQFVQELLQEVGNVPGVALLLSLPKSQKEFGGLEPEQLQRELQIVDDLQARADRVVSKRTPVNDDEIYTLMSRRLFKTVDNVAAQRVADAYRSVYERARDLYDPTVLSQDYLQNQLSAYPLHPELVDVLYKKWSTASDFPRTRTVLQLVAKVVADQWTNRREAYSIQSAHVNLERERIRTQIVSAASAAGGGVGWDAVVAADIIGGDAHADAMDQRLGGDYLKLHIARGVATSLLMHSFGGRVGALKQELRIGTVAPNVGPEYLEGILENFEQGALHYVHREGEFFKFDRRVNIFRKIAESAERQPTGTVTERLRAEISSKAAIGESPGFRVLSWAGSDGTLADSPSPTIALLDPKYVYTQENGDVNVPAAIQQLWERAGGGLRQFRNALVLIVPDGEFWSAAEAAQREVLAYDSVVSEADRGQLDLSDAEKKDLRSRLKDKQDSLRTALVSAYRWVFYPEESGLSGLGLPVPATRDETVTSRVVNRLSDQNYKQPKILKSLGASYFSSVLAPKLWPDESKPLDLAEMLRRFPQWTYLPILPRGEETLRTCIQEGVGMRLWAVAVGDAASNTYQMVIEEGPQLDGLAVLFDGSAYLVKGTLLEAVRPRKEPDVPAEPTPPSSAVIPVKDDTEEYNAAGAIPAPKRYRKLQLTVSALSIAKTPNLQNYLFKLLQQQDPGAQVQLDIEVTSSSGISDDLLNKQIVEGLEQLGISVSWHEG